MSDEPSASSTPSAPPSAPSPPTEADYEAIRAALAETAHGRWFLVEHARRSEHPDTQRILAAIERIESVLCDERAPSSFDRLPIQLAEMANAIACAQAEIAAIKPEDEHNGKVQEAQKIVQLVRYLEGRIDAMMVAWGEAAMAAAPGAPAFEDILSKGDDQHELAQNEAVPEPAPIAAPTARLEPGPIAAPTARPEPGPIAAPTARPEPAPIAVSDTGPELKPVDFMPVAAAITRRPPAPAPLKAMTRPLPSATPTDPLAAIAVLSEEEKTALFS